MKLLAISDLKIAPNRQRQEFDPEALMELTESIRDRGLLHAIVVREEGSDFYLVSGERRLRAIKDLFMLGDTLTYDGQIIPLDHIPTVTLGELSILDAEEAELDENLKRRDLSWQEHSEALLRLKRLREAQAAQAGLATPSVADIALEVVGRSDGAYQDNIRKELLVAQHLDDPEVSKAKNVTEAFKILKKKEEQKDLATRAAIVGTTYSASVHKCHNKDCLEWLAKEAPKGYYDVILTDPPYGMGADNFGDSGGGYLTITHQYDDSYESWKKLMEKWCGLAYEVAKPQAHAYVFCDIDRFHELKFFMEGAGWYVFRTPFIIEKVGSGRVPLPEHGPRRQWEMLLYAIKGKKPVTHIYPDVIKTTADESFGHGAQKPVALYQNLLLRSARPGDRALDTFGGTGTLIPASQILQVEATVVEKDPVSYGICLKRLELLQNGEKAV